MTKLYGPTQQIKPMNFIAEELNDSRSMLERSLKDIEIIMSKEKSFRNNNQNSSSQKKKQGQAQISEHLQEEANIFKQN